MKFYIAFALMVAAVIAVALGASPLEAGAPLVLAAVVQATYRENMDAAVAGMIATMVNWDATTHVLEDASPIGFGLAVGEGTNDGQCSLGGTLGTFLGVTIRDITQVPGASRTNPDTYIQYDNVGVLRMGEIWVQTTGTAPVRGDPVHYDATTGVFQTSGGSGPILGAAWTRAGANDLALLRLPAYTQS